MSVQEDQTEDYLRDEFELNQWESRQSLKFSGMLALESLPHVVLCIETNILMMPPSDHLSNGISFIDHHII